MDTMERKYQDQLDQDEDVINQLKDQLQAQTRN